MRHLSELVELLGHKHTLLCTKDTRLGYAQEKLLTYVRAHPTAGDQEGASHLGLEANSAAFRKVKHALKIALLNAVTRIAVSDRSTDNRKRTYAYVWKLITIGKQLRTSVASGILLPYLEEAFTTAAEAEFLSGAFQSASMLRRQYNNRRFDAAKYEYYRDRAREYRDVSRKYEDVVADLNELSYLRNVQRDPREIEEVAKRYHAHHVNAIQEYDVPAISYLVYLIELNRYLAARDYRAVIRVAETALAYLQKRDTSQPTMFQVFEVNLSVAYAQLNDFANGMNFARSLLEKTRPGEHNYLKVHEMMLLLCLRSAKFQEAYAIYRTMDLARISKQHPVHLAETFRIMEAYLYILYKLKQVVLQEDDTRLERFRLQRFVNSFQRASTEKSHRNVHLLILQIIDQVMRNRHTESHYSIEAITKYAQRHLRGPGYERVRYFLKALAQLSVQRFHRTAVERHTGRYLRKMQDYPLSESAQVYYMELVPYDLLWNLILGELGYKRVRQPRRKS